MSDDEEIETCEWCEDPATYRITAETKDKYERFSCGHHARKTERLVDLDLGNEVMRKHVISSVPFKRGEK